MANGGAAIFYGWRMVAACVVIATLTWTLGVFGVSVYLYTITTMQGWSTGLVSSAVTVFYLFGACLSMPVGSLIGRRGPRAVITAGAFAMGGGVAVLGQVSEPWQVYGAFMLLGVGYACLGSAALTTTLAPWFERHQGRAVSTALLGASIGGIVGVPALVAGIETIGFGAAAWVAGALIVVVVVPLAWRVLRTRPQDMGLLPDGESPRAGAAAPVAARTWRRVEALATWQLRSLIAAFGLGLMVQIGFLTHHVALVAPALGTGGAAALVSGTAVAAFLGRIALARFSDSVDVRHTAAAMFGAGTVALALLAWLRSPAALVAVSLFYGLTIGNVTTLSPIIVRREFGAASFGPVYGLSAMIIGLASCLGPSLYGWLHDLAGGYATPLMVASVVDALAAVIVIAGRPRVAPGTAPRSA